MLISVPLLSKLFYAIMDINSGLSFAQKEYDFNTEKLYFKYML